MTKLTILNFLKAHKNELRKKYGVKNIGLFGSYARGEETSQSDIDLLVDMPSSFNAFFGLKSYLEQHLKKNIDLGMEHKLRSFIKDHIKDEIIYV